MSENTAPQLPPGCPALLSPAQVAALHGVDPKTVTRWAKDGKLKSIRNPGAGGHRRYPAVQFAEVLAITGWPL
jgi:predicted site-specific integrase-resolvase